MYFLGLLQKIPPDTCISVMKAEATLGAVHLSVQHGPGKEGSDWYLWLKDRIRVVGGNC